MKSKIILVIINFVLLISCVKEEQKIEDSISIDLSRESIEYKFDFELIKNIVLESTDESIYMKAKKIWMNDSSIYLLDGDVDHRKLMHFSSSGEFREKTKKGKGPGEFLYLSDFYYDQENKQICAVALIRKKLVVFNESLKLIKEQDLSVGDVVENIAMLNNDHWLINRPYTGRAPRENFYYYGIANSTNFKDTDQYYFELPYALKYHNLSDPIARHYDKTIKVACPMDDMHIYKIVNDSLSVAYTFDFGDFTLPMEIIWGKTADELFPLLRKSKFVSGINKIVETEKFLAFQFFWQQKLEFLIMNRSNRKYITSFELRHKCQLPYGQLMTIDPDGNFVIMTDPKTFKRWQREFDQSDVFNDVKESDNDILTLFYINF